MQPVIGIIMGSDSDLPVVKGAAEVLEELGVSYEMAILSAHRTPEMVKEYAEQAALRGIKAIIAAAGGAAHLPGVVAAYTVLPVIGLPIRSQALNGVDSLYSMVQMPPGVPVAVVGIDAARNAGLLAAEIAAIGDPALQGRLWDLRHRQAAKVLEKSEHLRQVGFRDYLRERGQMG